MNQAQYIQPGHEDLVKEHAGHPVKRKWTDSFLHLGQAESTGNDGHVMKVPNTSSSVTSSSSSEDTDGTKIDMEEEDEDIKVKRKAQNRAAQRAFRERKERYVKDLEIKIKQVQDNHVFTTNQLFQENHHLRSIICRLEAENSALRGVIPLAATSTNNNNNNTNNSSNDFFASLGLLSPDPQLPSLNLSPLPPISLHPPPPPPPSSSSSVGLQDTLSYHPIQPSPMTIKHSHPKPLASKPPVPILPQQPQHTQPIITAKLPSPSNKKGSRALSKSTSTANNTRQPSSPSPSRPQQPQQPQQQQQQQSQQLQQQEFTFSISTPATLRADTTGKNNQMDPIELIPLYHPDHHGQRSSPDQQPKEVHLEESRPLSNNTPSAIIVRNDDDDIIHNDNGEQPQADGSNSMSLGSFLDGYDAFERLYVHQDHSLFDDNGLALSMMQSRRNSVTDQQHQPIPVTHHQVQEETSPLNEEKSAPPKEETTAPVKTIPTTTLANEEESLTMMMIKDKKMEAMIKNQKASSGSADNVMMMNMGSDDLVDLSSSQRSQHHSQQQQHTNLLLQQQTHQGNNGVGSTAVPSTIVMEDDEKTPIWQKITEHAQNNKFSVDHLVEAVRNTTTSKRKNKLLVDEWELEAMVHDLNYYL